MFLRDYISSLLAGNDQEQAAVAVPPQPENDESQDPAQVLRRKLFKENQEEVKKITKDGWSNALWGWGAVFRQVVDGKHGERLCFKQAVGTIDLDQVKLPGRFETTTIAQKIREICLSRNILPSLKMDKIDVTSILLAIPGIHYKEDRDLQWVTSGAYAVNTGSHFYIAIDYPLDEHSDYHIKHHLKAESDSSDLFGDVYKNGVESQQIPNLLTDNSLNPSYACFERIKKLSHLMVILNFSENYFQGKPDGTLMLDNVKVYVIGAAVMNTKGLMLTRAHRQTIDGAMQHYADELVRLYDKNYKYPYSNNVRIPPYRTAADIIKRLEEMETKYQVPDAPAETTKFAASLHAFTDSLKSPSSTMDDKSAAVENLRRSMALFESTQTKEQNKKFKKGDKHLIKDYEFEFEIPDCKCVRKAW